MFQDPKLREIIGEDNIRVISGEECINLEGTIRFADAIIDGRIDGDPEKARRLKPQLMLFAKDFTKQGGKGAN